MRLPVREVERDKNQGHTLRELPRFRGMKSSQRRWMVRRQETSEQSKEKGVEEILMVGKHLNYRLFNKKYTQFIL